MSRAPRDWFQRLDQWGTRRMGVEARREIDERVLTKHRRLFGERGFTVINGKHQLATRLRAEGRNEEALDLFEQVLVQRAERYGPDHPKTRATKLSLAITLIDLGRTKEARTILSDLVHTCARLQGDADNETQRCRLWLASTLIVLGDYAAAQDELSKLFDAAKIRGQWWDPEAEDRTKEFWRTVTSDEVPE
jgi:hypothetical protein